MKIVTTTLILLLAAASAWAIDIHSAKEQGLDGSLDGIVDRFSGHKVLSLQFAEESMPENLDRYGEVLSVDPPKARLKVERDGIAGVLSSVLASHSVADVSVEDPPLEEVIAEMFTVASDVQDSSETLMPAAMN